MVHAVCVELQKDCVRYNPSQDSNTYKMRFIVPGMDAKSLTTTRTRDLFSCRRSVVPEPKDNQSHQGKFLSTPIISLFNSPSSSQTDRDILQLVPNATLRCGLRIAIVAPQIDRARYTHPRNIYLDSVGDIHNNTKPRLDWLETKYSGC